MHFQSFLRNPAISVWVFISLLKSRSGVHITYIYNIYRYLKIHQIILYSIIRDHIHQISYEITYHNGIKGIVMEKRNQIQWEFHITFQLRNTAPRSLVPKDWEVPPSTSDPNFGRQYKRYSRLYYWNSVVTLSLAKRHMHQPRAAQSSAENMWQKPMSRQHAPCTDKCAPWYIFRADDVQGTFKPERF